MGEAQRSLSPHRLAEDPAPYGTQLGEHSAHADAKNPVEGDGVQAFRYPAERNFIKKALDKRK
jgi:hypothetical protein